jgi:hypothetical protein
MKAKAAVRMLASGLVIAVVAGCSGSAPSPEAQRAELQAALKRYAQAHGAFTSSLLPALGRLDLAAAHAAVARMRAGTARFDAAVGSLVPPRGGQTDAAALVRADRREANDLAQAAAARTLPGVILAVGRWAKDGGTELTLAIRLREDLGT